MLCPTNGHGSREARSPAITPNSLRLGSGALFLYRLLNLLLADLLKLLVLLRRQNLLDLRARLLMDRMELLHLLHARKRGVGFDGLKLRSFLFENREEFHLLLRREI